jgi:hypothetical protein
MDCPNNTSRAVDGHENEIDVASSGVLGHVRYRVNG